MKDFSALSLEIAILALTILIGAIPLFKDIKTKGKKLNKWGLFLILGLILFFLTNIILMVKNKADDFEKEKTVTTNRKTDSTMIASMAKRLHIISQSYSSIRAAIKMSGLIYDSTKGIIIGKNIQMIRGGSGFQNNAPNYGYQAARDINVHPQKELTPEELKEHLITIKKMLKDNKLNNVVLLMKTDSNGGKIKSQLELELLKLGYTVSNGMSYATATIEGIEASIDKTEGALFLTFGRF